MAYSTQRATSDGTLDYLALSIDYLNRTDLAVFINDLPTTEGVDWDWDGSNNAITFPAPLPDGDEVLIARTTDLAEVLHVFSAQQGGGGSAKFTNLTMDENFLQLLLIAQEAKEGSSLSDIFQNLDMHGYKILNLGEGDENDPNAVPNMNQMMLKAGSVGASASAAAASASAAATARTGAETARTGAETARTGAETARTGAESAKTAAETARTQAQTARTGAESARDAAAGSATAASDSATEAEDWANKLGSTVDGVEYSAKKYAQDAHQSALDAEGWASTVDNEALSTEFYGPTAPAVTFPGMVWADSDSGVLFRRDPAGALWIPERRLFQDMTSYSPVGSFKNKLINGNFDVWQAGTSFTVSGYSADNWSTNWSGSPLPTAAVSRYKFPITDPLPDGSRPRYGLEFEITSGGGATNGNVQAATAMESAYTLAGQSAAYAVWVYCGQAGRSISVEFIRVYGSDGSPTELGIGVRKFPLEVGWNLISGVADIPGLSGKTLGSDSTDRLIFIMHLSAGTTFNERTDSLGIQTGTFRFARAQVEAGKFPTTFDDRGPDAAYLESCRYYTRFGRTDFYMRRSSGVTAARLPFPTSMRVVPTVSLYDLGSPVNSGKGSVVNTSGGATNNISVDVINVQSIGIGLLQATGYGANQDVICFSRIDVDARF